MCLPSSKKYIQRSRKATPSYTTGHNAEGYPLPSSFLSLRPRLLISFIMTISYPLYYRLSVLPLAPTSPLPPALPPSPSILLCQHARTRTSYRPSSSHFVRRAKERDADGRDGRRGREMEEMEEEELCQGRLRYILWLVVSYRIIVMFRRHGVGGKR